MQTIDFKSTWQNYREAFTRYNDTCITGRRQDNRPTYDLSRKLRKEHQQLIRVMLWLYLEQLSSKPWTSLHAGQRLPDFQTNSPALARVLLCNPRTIRNLIARLLDAGMIESKETLGRRQNFRIRFRKDLLVGIRKEGTKAQKHCLDRAIQQCENEALEEELRKELPPLLTEKINKKSNETCGQAQSEKNDRQLPARQGTGNTTLQDAQNAFSEVEPLEETGPERLPNTNETTQQENGAGAASEQFESPVTVPGLDWERFEEYEMRLFSLIVATCYSKLEFMASSQVRQIRKYLGHAFLDSNPEEYEATYQQLRTRVLLVDAWLQRDPNRFVPIPDFFFRIGNPNGFDRTAEWLRDMRMTTQKANAYKHRYQYLMKAWGGFMQTVGRAVDEPGLSTYAQGRKLVKNRYVDLTRAYDYVILHLQSNPS